MLILTVENKILNTDSLSVGDTVNHGILSFQPTEDNAGPDFYFPVIEYLDEFSAASITLKLGDNRIIMPLHWSILCTDTEYLQTIPLYEVGGKQFPVFCLNPLTGFAPEFLRLKTGNVFPNSTWTAPQLNEKDLLVVPIETKEEGPLCAFFSPSKYEVYRALGEVW